VINREILLTLGHANVEQFVANKLRLERWTEEAVTTATVTYKNTLCETVVLTKHEPNNAWKTGELINLIIWKLP
jgi:hypothetical protein